MKILAVDDNPQRALRLQEALQRSGFTATLVRDGEVAWKELSAQTSVTEDDPIRPLYDGVIAAWNAPGLSGLDLVRRARHPQIGVADLPIILVHDAADGVSLRAALDAGAQGCVRTIESAVELADELIQPERADERRELAERTPDNALSVVRRSGDDTRRSFGARERLGDILVSHGILSPIQLQNALDIQSYTRERLGTVLVGKGWVSESQIVAAYSEQVDMPFVAVESAMIFEPAITLVPRDQALRYAALALEPDPSEIAESAPVRVAVSDPWNIAAIDLYQQILRRRVVAVLAEESALRAAIDHAYSSSERTFDKTELARSLEQSVSDLNGGVDLTDLEAADPDATIGADQAPVIRFVNGIIVEAVRRRASDIHIEPYKQDFEVRYRIDGILHTIHTPPRTSFPAVVSRVKIMAELDIAERRMPQDGRIGLRVDDRPIQLRVSTLPNHFGERVVMRILDGAATRRSVSDLGFSDHNQKRFEHLIRRPHGILLVTGPTGSGKTTTLYSALNALRSPEINIMTCEDPIEYEMDRISQSMVNPRAGLTFAAQLRAILRQDPDVVLVGEIRDGETAEIAFKAAMTGHLVLSTLHCNEAASAGPRLMDMGVEPYLIASGLNGSVAQRLVRRLCPHCRVMSPPTAEEQRILEALNGGNPLEIPTIGKKVGCGRCNGIGTLGRVGIHEILAMDEALAHLTMARATSSALQEAAVRSGMIPLIGDGLIKVVQGVALLEDVQKKVLAE